MDTIINYDHLYRNVDKFIDRVDGCTAVCRQLLDSINTKIASVKILRKMFLKSVSLFHKSAKPFLQSSELGLPHPPRGDTHCGTIHMYFVVCF